jgi:hypothetical protein
LALGCPIANIPLGRDYLKDKLSRPFGLAVLAKRGGEGDIFRFMAAYEASFLARGIPERLLKFPNTFKGSLISLRRYLLMVQAPLWRVFLPLIRADI